MDKQTKVTPKQTKVTPKQTLAANKEAENITCLSCGTTGLFETELVNFHYCPVCNNGVDGYGH